MIKVSEVYKALGKIDSSFDLDFPRSALIEIQSLQERLTREVTGTCTDIDLTLIELRGNLMAYSKSNFRDITEARLFFKEKILKNFINDLKSSEIKRFIGLAAKLERLL